MTFIFDEEYILNLVMGYFVLFVGKLKNFTNFKLRKQLAGCLNLDCYDVVYCPIPKRLVKRLQRVEYAAAAFVVCR